ncbi:MAG: 2-oxoacid:acceptor oxidoreductase family protein, partial [Lentisphaeria bacterium]|nr:2-oxoacid:acceptor oxidoreductase family protein [Lentisphaeria bacterium]
YDTSTIKQPEVSADKTVFGIAASDLANTLGDQRVANSVLLGAIAAMMEECFLTGDEKADMDRVAHEAIQEHFAKKPAVAELNWKAYELGKKSITVKFGARIK